MFLTIKLCVYAKLTVYLYKNGFGINSLQWLMSHKTKPNLMSHKTKPNLSMGQIELN